MRDRLRGLQPSVLAKEVEDPAAEHGGVFPCPSRVENKSMRKLLIFGDDKTEADTGMGLLQRLFSSIRLPALEELSVQRLGSAEPWDVSFLVVPSCPSLRRLSLESCPGATVPAKDERETHSPPFPRALDVSLDVCFIIEDDI